MCPWMNPPRGTVDFKALVTDTTERGAKRSKQQLIRVKCDNV